ncbi:MAG: DUF3187 family protein, partial [Pseudomonadales bacterium]|nr:DUF3187 family protein [Pseudomonadales bacterium]
MFQVGPIKWIVLLLLSSGAHAESAPYYLRHQNPFLQVFGLPAPEGGGITGKGLLDYSFVLTVANHADSGRKVNEEVRLDGESYYAALVFRYGLRERWEVGIDLPFIRHDDGVLDNVIEGWHDTFGLSNRKREGPDNQLAFIYRRNGLEEFAMRDPVSGIGDVRLTVARQISNGDDDGRSVALRAQLKLPTGNADRLLGSGAADISLAADATDSATLGEYRIVLFGQLGVLGLGHGDLLPHQQQDIVSFASGGLAWQWTDRIEIQAQVAFQDPYFDS